MTIPIWQRILGVYIYMLPWSESIPFGYNLFYNFPILKILLIPALPIIFIKQIIPFSGFLIFILLFFTVIRNPKINYFLRYNSLQSILISIGISIINLGFQIFLYPISNNLITRTFSSTVLISIIAIITFCIIESIKGEAPNLPVISDAVKMQI
tara:strand:+ start:2782 stop:3243 length:462 start_codon:yes stop_codon:yes gene_type:complete